MFKRYHLEHHQFQGDREKDADIPTKWEADLVGNSTLKKLIYLTLQFIAYGARPGYVRPKKYRSQEYINVAVVITTDVLIFLFCGLPGILYMFLSLALGMGLHPVAGHFIAEHYVFSEGHETYSYYGTLNWLCWNVGYHNEHHDFPRVPGWKLPLGKAQFFHRVDTSF
jgi:sphingolipid delta-4 desaturase